MSNLYILENDYWQVGVLPDTGGSIAFGRVKHKEQWLDIMRPTAEINYDKPGECASFVLIPWSNRIGHAKFRFKGAEHTLVPNFPDNTAIHGVVWEHKLIIESFSKTYIRMSFDSQNYENVNFPFMFSSQVEYRLEDENLILWISLQNKDVHDIPGGFGHHPYFMRDENNLVQLEIPCDHIYELVNSLAQTPPVPIPEKFDFQKLRPLADVPIDNVLTGRNSQSPYRIVYPEQAIELKMYSDPIFKHMIAHAPKGKPYFAIEPLTNTNDGFNFFEKGFSESGVFILQPGQEKSGTVQITFNNI